MKGTELVAAIEARRRPDLQFIKWWRREEDFLDYDLIDRFLQNTDPEEEIGGFELVGMDEVWERVKHVAGDRVRHEMREESDSVEWKRGAEGGEIRKFSCAWSPENLLKILDVETRGSVID